MARIQNSANPIKTIQEIITDEQGRQEVKDVWVHTHADGVQFDDETVLSDVLQDLKDKKADKSTIINGHSIGKSFDLKAEDIGAAEVNHTHTPENIGAANADAVNRIEKNLNELKSFVNKALENSKQIKELQISTNPSAPTIFPSENGIYVAANEGYLNKSGASNFTQLGTFFIKSSLTDVTAIAYLSIRTFFFKNDVLTLVDEFAKTSDIEEVMSSIEEFKSKTVLKTEKGVPNGVASLDEHGMIPTAQLPGFVDDVIDGNYIEEDGTFIEAQLITESSNHLFINHCATPSVSNFKIRGKSVQNGVPKPGIPVDIVSVGDSGNIEFKSSNENILNTFSDEWNIGVGISCDGESATPWAEDPSMLHCAYIKVNVSSNTKYSFYNPYADYTMVYRMIELNSKDLAIKNYAFYDDIQNMDYYDYSFSFTTKAETCAILFVISTFPYDVNETPYEFPDITDDDAMYCDIVMNVGEPITDEFIEHEGEEQTISLTEPLRSLPSGVCDTYENGVITRRVGALVVDGTDTSSMSIVNAYSGKRKVLQLTTPLKKRGTYTSICSHFEYVRFISIGHENDYGLYSEYDYDKFIFLAPNATMTTVAHWADYFKANPVTILYELETPTSEEAVSLEFETIRPIMSIYNTGNVIVDVSYLQSKNNKIIDGVETSVPITPEGGKIYLDVLTNKTYRWSGSQYVAIGSSMALGETSSTAYAGDKGKALADTVSRLHDSAFTGDAVTVNGHTVAKDVPADADFISTRKYLGFINKSLIELEPGWYEYKEQTVISINTKKGAVYITMKEGSFIYHFIKENVYYYYLLSDKLCGFVTSESKPTNTSLFEIHHDVNELNFPDILAKHIGPTNTIPSEPFTGSNIETINVDDLPVGITYITDPCIIQYGSISSDIFECEKGEYFIKMVAEGAYRCYFFSLRFGFKTLIKKGIDTNFTYSIFATKNDIIAPINNLDSTSTTAPLAANQGKMLNDKIENLKKEIVVGADSIKLSGKTILHGTTTIECTVTSNEEMVAGNITINYSDCKFTAAPTVIITPKHTMLDATVNITIKDKTKCIIGVFGYIPEPFNLNVDYIIIGNTAV